MGDPLDLTRLLKPIGVVPRIGTMFDGIAVMKLRAFCASNASHDWVIAPDADALFCHACKLRVTPEEIVSEPFDLPACRRGLRVVP